MPASERVIPPAAVVSRLSFSDGEGKLLMHCSLARPMMAQPVPYREPICASSSPPAPSGQGNWVFHIQRSNGIDFAKIFKAGGASDARYILETLTGEKLLFFHTAGCRSLSIADEDSN